MDQDKPTSAKARRVISSKAYQRAKGRAEECGKDPRSIAVIAVEAAAKIQKSPGPIGKIIDSVAACIRLVGAYANGSYRIVPWQSLVLIVAAILYFVMPIDLIPDFIPGIGLIDDAAILTWTINAMRKDLDSFIGWEKKQ